MNLLKSIFFFALFPAQILWSTVSVKDRMIADLEIIKNAYEVCYAPAEWKKTFADWDLDVEFQKAKDQIDSIDYITTKDYQRIVKHFLLSTKDYHVSPLFHSTEMSALPFRLQGAEGRYFVVQTNNKLRNYLEIPLQVGDEILTFNHIPIHEAIQNFRRSEFGNPDSETDQGMAEGFFTSRLGSLGHLVPQGQCVITVKHKANGATATYAPHWEYYPEQIEAAYNRRNNKGWIELEEDQPLSAHGFFTKKMSTPYAVALKGMQELLGQEDRDMMGSALDILCGNNQILWQANSNFYKAYVYETSKKQKIGYIRIPTYHATYAEAQEFAQLIAGYQVNTDALIIDQQNNPGGYFFYMYAIASMLTDKPLKVPLHKQTLTQEDVAFALQYLNHIESIRNNYEAKQILGSTLQGYGVNFLVAQQFKSHFHRIIEEWNLGSMITSPISLYGIDEIQPHPTARYTKPLLILINHMDFSCADFLPAILQDNKRALLLGTKTAGAGGFILKAAHPNRFGIASYSYTGSIAERLDHRPIENLGVTPDIPYRMTANDLLNGYQDYHQALQNAIDLILKK
ncbi:MAG: protease-like activity factor CPAF [Parachlamydiales bacterium]|jgi:hypothetical protein